MEIKNFYVYQPSLLFKKLFIYHYLLFMTLNIPLYYHFYCLHISFVVYFVFLDTISSFFLHEQQ